MKRVLLPVAFGAALLFPGRALADDVGDWVGDFDKAVAQARAEHKDLLVDFTGSDWCGWCIKLHGEVFEHEAFLSSAKKDYVLVALDFPNAPEVKARVPNPERNAELAKKYGVQGYPTVLLMTADGDVFGRTGYQPGGPEAYVTHMGELRSAGRPGLEAAIKSVAAIQAATGDEQVALLGKAIDELAALDPEKAWGAKLAEGVRVAVTLDKDGTLGLRERAVVALFKSGHAGDAERKLATELDPKNEKGLLEQAVEAQCQSVASKEDVAAAVPAIKALAAFAIQDKERAQRILVNGAYWAWKVTEDLETAKFLAGKAKELGIEDPRFRQVIEQILSAE